MSTTEPVIMDFRANSHDAPIIDRTVDLWRAALPLEAEALADDAARFDTGEMIWNPGVTPHTEQGMIYARIQLPLVDVPRHLLAVGLCAVALELCRPHLHDALVTIRNRVSEAGAGVGTRWPMSPPTYQSNVLADHTAVDVLAAATVRRIERQKITTPVSPAQ